MKQETITRIKLTAAKGKILTNGKTYGREVFLSETDNPENWYEITEEEYKTIQENIDAQVSTVESE